VAAASNALHAAAASSVSAVSGKTIGV